MRRLTPIFLLLFLACRAVNLASPATRVVSTATLPVATLSPTPLPTITSTPFPPFDDASSTASVTPAVNRGFIVRFHPDGTLYVGDLVSLEVIPPPGIDLEGHSARIELETFQGIKTVEEKFISFGIGGRLQATFQWAWDTTGLTSGEHFLTISILPEGASWRETAYLSPYGQEPPPEPYARWASTESDCCLVYYISGTAVERDLTGLLETLDEQASEITQQLGANQGEATTVTFLPRVLGHGGFAGQGISVSYLDRNYAGGNPATIIHHEMAHILDSRLGGELRPIALLEGFAVYLSGGHFKPEVLLPRAAALLPPVTGCTPWLSSGTSSSSTDQAIGCGLDQYIDFSSLIGNFYFEQHEIGYLEAGALVEFMVETWGWEAFSEFYRDIHVQPSVSEGAEIKSNDQYRAMNAALVAHFGITLEQLEERFLLALSQENFTPEHSEDVRMTVMFYDSIRRYQELLDPSAYFLTAWMPEVDQMQKRGIVADYLRRPEGMENLTLESMLVTANSYLLDGQYDLTASILEAVNAVLDAYPVEGNQAFKAHPLAEDTLALVVSVSTEGFTPERIIVDGNTARVWARKADPMLLELFYIRDQEGWILQAEN